MERVIQEACLVPWRSFARNPFTGLASLVGASREYFASYSPNSNLLSIFFNDRLLHSREIIGLEKFSLSDALLVAIQRESQSYFLVVYDLRSLLREIARSPLRCENPLEMRLYNENKQQVILVAYTACIDRFLISSFGEPPEIVLGCTRCIPRAFLTSLSSLVISDGSLWKDGVRTESLQCPPIIYTDSFNASHIAVLSAGVVSIVEIATRITKRIAVSSTTRKVFFFEGKETLLLQDNASLFTLKVSTEESSPLPHNALCVLRSTSSVLLCISKSGNISKLRRDGVEYQVRWVLNHLRPKSPLECALESTPFDFQAWYPDAYSFLQDYLCRFPADEKKIINAAFIRKFVTKEPRFQALFNQFLPKTELQEIWQHFSASFGWSEYQQRCKLFQFWSATAAITGSPLSPSILCNSFVQDTLLLLAAQGNLKLLQGLFVDWIESGEQLRWMLLLEIPEFIDPLDCSFLVPPTAPPANWYRTKTASLYEAFRSTGAVLSYLNTLGVPSDEFIASRISLWNRLPPPNDLSFSLFLSKEAPLELIDLLLGSVFADRKKQAESIGLLLEIVENSLEAFAFLLQKSPTLLALVNHDRFWLLPTGSLIPQQLVSFYDSIEANCDPSMEQVVVIGRLFLRYSLPLCFKSHSELSKSLESVSFLRSLVDRVLDRGNRDWNALLEDLLLIANYSPMHRPYLTNWIAERFLLQLIYKNQLDIASRLIASGTLSTDRLPDAINSFALESLSGFGVINSKAVEKAQYLCNCLSLIRSTPDDRLKTVLRHLVPVISRLNASMPADHRIQGDRLCRIASSQFLVAAITNFFVDEIFYLHPSAWKAPDMLVSELANCVDENEVYFAALRIRWEKEKQISWADKIEPCTPGFLPFLLRNCPDTSNLLLWQSASPLLLGRLVKSGKIGSEKSLSPRISSATRSDSGLLRVFTREELADANSDLLIPWIVHPDANFWALQREKIQKEAQKLASEKEIPEVAHDLLTARSVACWKSSFLSILDEGTKDRVLKRLFSFFILTSSLEDGAVWKIVLDEDIFKSLLTANEVDQIYKNDQLTVFRGEILFRFALGVPNVQLDLERLIFCCMRSPDSKHALLRSLLRGSLSLAELSIGDAFSLVVAISLLGQPDFPTESILIRESSDRLNVENGFDPLIFDILPSDAILKSLVGGSVLAVRRVCLYSLSRGFSIFRESLAHLLSADALGSFFIYLYAPDSNIQHHVSLENEPLDRLLQIDSGVMTLWSLQDHPLESDVEKFLFVVRYQNSIDDIGVFLSFNPILSTLAGPVSSWAALLLIFRLLSGCSGSDDALSLAYQWGVSYLGAALSRKEISTKGKETLVRVIIDSYLSRSRDEFESLSLPEIPSTHPTDSQLTASLYHLIVYGQLRKFTWDHLIEQSEEIKRLLL